MNSSIPHRIKTTRRPTNARRGFALLITITLLSFLVLLLVSLASLTRVETQVAGNNQQLAQARQNALFALNMALGQLQKHTGADQRVTGPADLAAAASGTALPSGTAAQNTSSINGTVNGLGAVSGSSIQAGTRYWTGVWGRAGTTYATPAKSIYEETPSPVLLNWLVSGNENLDFTIDAAGLVKTSSADGRSAGTTAPFTPGSPINWAAASLDPANPAGWTVDGYSKLEIKSAGQKGILLVGPRSAGVTNNAVERYVVAPARDISIPSSQVPGAGSSGSTLIGRYAWWVGDEGVKASYILADTRAGKTNPGSNNASAADARVRLMTASRTGMELTPGYSAYPPADDTNSAVRLGRIVDITQSALLDATLPAETQRGHFHDFTINSEGVLSNALDGGLRQDLTYYFELSQSAWNSSALAGKGIIPGTYSPNWGTSAAPNYAPKWDWLYSFYNTNPDVATSKLTVRPETATQVGVTPIITQFRMIAFTDGTKLGPANNVNNISPGAYSLPLRCNVAFVLANPYNVTLEAPANAYEFVLKNTWTSSNPVPPAAATDLPAGLVIGASALSHAYNASYGNIVLLRAPNADPAMKSVLDAVRFVLPGFSIPPGGTAVFSVKGNSQIAGGVTPPANGAEEPVELELNDSGNPIVAKTRYFTARNTLDFTAPGLPPPATGQPRTIILMYLHDQVFITASLRQANAGPLLQQWSDFGFSKTGETGSYENDIFGNLHMKFLGTARRDMNSAAPGEVFHYALFSYARPYIDLNLRSSIVDHTALDQPGKLWTAPSFGSGFSRNGSQSISGAFTENLTPATWTENFGPETRSPVAPRGVFFDFPRRTTEQPPILSLGQLQHASLTADDWHPNTSINYQSAYAVGNSYSNPWVARAKSIDNRTKSYYKAPNTATRYFDMAYLLNTSLWDGYFFSGVPQTGSAYQPLNPRYKTYDDPDAAELRAKNSSAHLLTKGAFNINSTSQAAWVALLGGLNTLRVNNDSTDEGVPFPRTLWQPVNNSKTGTSYKSSGTGDDAYAGYRRLSAAEIDALAAEIVKRVRARGPFLSLSHFINRSLVAASTAFNSSINDANTSGDLAASAVPMGRGLSGPLQAAIDSAASGINTFQKVGSDIVTGDGAGAYGDRVLFAGEMLSTLAQRPWVAGEASFNKEPAFFADKLVDLPNVDPVFANPGAPGPQGRTSTGIPGWLLQGDVLQALGPALSPRSDTFIIRTYGEVVNPADANQTQARAWCEAVVQRLPEYVQPSADAPETAQAALTSADNRMFGRGYKVVSFRWLSATDI